MTKTEILDALAAFVARRPGFDTSAYAGHPEAYRADLRRVTRQLRDARALIRAAERCSVSAETIIAEKFHRLDIYKSGGAVRVDHTPCQYPPTEYRAAVCESLARALWAFYRDACGGSSAEKIRAIARRELGAALARRFFV